MQDVAILGKVQQILNNFPIETNWYDKYTPITNQQTITGLTPGVYYEVLNITGKSYLATAYSVGGVDRIRITIDGVVVASFSLSLTGGSYSPGFINIQDIHSTNQNSIGVKGSSNSIIALSTTGTHYKAYPFVSETTQALIIANQPIFAKESLKVEFRASVTWFEFITRGGYVA